MLAGCGHGLMFPRPRLALARPGEVIELPCRIGPGGLVLIRGLVNGRAEAEFILDTGAPVSVLIDGPSTAALGLDSTGARKLGPADDPAAPVGVLRPHFELAFGGLTLSGLTVVVIPQASMPCSERFAAVGFQGVIGADLMREFVVEVDSRAQRVRLHAPSAWQPSPGATVLPLSFEQGHCFVQAAGVVAGQAVPALHLHVDTGQREALVLVIGSRAELHAGLRRESRESCYVAGKREVWRGEPVQLTLGGLQLGDVLPSYHLTKDSPRVSGRHGGLGIGLLGQHRLSIDYVGSRLVLAAAA